MNDMQDNVPVPNGVGINPDKLNTFFLNHLNLIYSAKAHLIERLAEIVDNPEFEDLQFVIAETLQNSESQALLLDDIYSLLGGKPSLNNCAGFIDFIEDAFHKIRLQNTNTELRNLSILFYMQHIENMELTSFKLLQAIAGRFNNQEVLLLLNQNFARARTGKTLLYMLAQNYIK